MIESREPMIRVPCAACVSGSLSLTLLHSVDADPRAMDRPARATLSARSGHDLELLDIKAVSLLLRVSQRHISTLVSKHEFPKPIKLGNSSRWRSTDIQAFLSRPPEASSDAP
ncbi:helix-turn-helix domain-containing protein [Planctomyces sp. SH-PL14]|uniref:helix-turn-helix transcriptional regulator n=1 Tax=Planctomyces sp. SH-PL14 TaxID=1632864 RepID=UPI0012E8EC8F